MRAKIQMEIAPDGKVTVKTVQGVGTNCRAVADQLASVLGKADESTRADTEDLYQTGETDITVTA